MSDSPHTGTTGANPPGKPPVSGPQPASPQDTRGEATPPPPTIGEFGKWLPYHLRKDVPMMARNTPLGTIAVFVGSIVSAWLLTWHVVVPEKNEQLNTKQGQIKFLNRKLEDQKDYPTVVSQRDGLRGETKVLREDKEDLANRLRLSENSNVRLGIQIDTLTNDLLFATEHIRIGIKLRNAKEYSELAACGWNEFDIGQYVLACRYYDRAFALEQLVEGTHSMMAQNEPVYRCAILKTNVTPETRGIFRNALTDMTNRMSAMIKSREKSMYSHPDTFKTIVMAVKEIQDRAPKEESDFIADILKSAQALQEEAAESISSTK